MAVLKMLTGPMTGDFVALMPEGVQIGRGESNQLRIVEASVSSRHARIWQDQGYWWLQDLGSTNGTLINNAEAPVNSPVPLTSGDKLAFGHVVAAFDAFMDLTPPEPEPQPEPLVEVAPAPDLLAEANGRIEALQAALTAAQQQLAQAQSADLVPRSELETAFAAERDAFRRQLREMEQKLVDQAAEVQAFQRSLEEKGVQGGLPSKEREALEASERERRTLEEALSQSTEREHALQAQLDVLHKELREISGVRRVAAADAEVEQKRADTLEQQIVVLERAVAVAQQDEEAARQEAARVDELNAELAAARSNLEAVTAQLAEAESFSHELRRELDRQQQATAAQEADLVAVRQQGVQLRERILLLEQQLTDAEGKATDELDELRGQWKTATERGEALAAEVEQANNAAAVLEEKLNALDAEVAQKTATIEALEAQLAQGDEGANAALEAARSESLALKAERDELRTTVQKLGAELESLRVERDAIQVERDEIRVERDAIQVERDEIRVERDEIRVERDAIQVERDEIRVERDAIQVERDEIRVDCEELRQKVDSGADAFAALQAQLAAGDEGAKAAVETARSEAAALTEKLSLVESEVASKADQIAALQAQLAAGDEGAKAAVETARSEAAALTEKLSLVESEVASKADQIAALQAQLAAGDEGAKAAIDAARSEAAALTEKLSLVESEVASKAEQIAALQAQLAAGDEGAKAAIEASRSEAAALTEKLSLVESEVTSKAEQIAALQAQLAAGDEGAKAAIEAARSEAAALTERIATLEAQLSSGDERVKAALDSAEDADRRGREQLAALEERFALEREAAGAEVTVLKEQLATLEAQSAALHEECARAQAQVAALEEQLASRADAPSEAPAASSDWVEVEYARAKFTTLRGLLEIGAEAVNGDISRVRRNAEIFRGYLDDVDRVASFVASLDPSGLNPSDQTQWQALIDEVGPSEVVAQLRAMADENADAASSTKGLVLELKNAVAPSETGADLEQALLAGQGLLPDASLPVESSELLPLLACEMSEAVLFGFAVAQEAVDLGEGSPAVTLSREGDAVRLALEPLSGRTRSRWTETAQGGGDDRSRFLHGFVTRTCSGEVSVEDASDGCRLVFVFNATRPA